MKIGVKTDKWLRLVRFLVMNEAIRVFKTAVYSGRPTIYSVFGFLIGGNIDKSDKKNIMHIHILGICGTFMGSLAQLAVAQGHRVTGSDQNVYPPMSTQLENAGIEITQGFAADQLKPAPDLVVIGNAMSRGNEAVEYVLNKQIPYTSGPAYLADHILKNKWVMAVAGYSWKKPLLPVCWLGC